MRISPITKYPIARIPLVWIIAGVAAVASSWAWTSPSHARAVAASSQAIHETAHLHSIARHGASFTEQGHATGTFNCTLTLRLTTTPKGVTIQLEATPSGGALKAHGSATTEAAGALAKVAGTVAVSGGSGRYAHAHGSGLRVSGTFNRENYKLAVTLSGKFFY